jgi:hypothetical protein
MTNLARKSTIVNLNLGKNYMNFLPDGYEPPKTTSENYMKKFPGENKIRILTSPVMGWEDWDDKTPLRYRYNDKPETVLSDQGIKHFWAFVVFNYAQERIQILNVTQAQIQNGISKLCSDSEWGSPFGYDIKIIQSGEKKNTKYDVNPCPHKPIAEYILEQFEAKPCQLEALFANDDPFSPKWKSFTPLMGASVISRPPELNGISLSQVKEIKDLIFQDSDGDEALKMLLLKAKCSQIESIPEDKFSGALIWLKQRLDSQKNLQEVPF